MSKNQDPQAKFPIDHQLAHFLIDKKLPIWNNNEEDNQKEEKKKDFLHSCNFVQTYV